MVRALAALCAVLPLWLPVTAAADVVTIPPDRDNTLFEDASGSLSNGAGPVLFTGNNGQGLARRALLRFDVAASLPPGALVGDVALTLNVSNASSSTSYLFTVHRVLANWGEGASSTTSGGGTSATANDATWLHTYYPSQFWEGPGGAFVSSPSAQQSIAGVGFYTWADPGLSADVQAWLDDPSANFGWLIQGDEVTLNTARRFDSRENAVVTSRPALTITYTNIVGVPGETARGGGWLVECRPNPAVGVARVAFQLPARAHARLLVRDLAGRPVATLVEGSLGPGRHEVSWRSRDDRGSPAPAGIYFGQLTVDGRTVASRRLAMMP